MASVTERYQKAESISRIAEEPNLRLTDRYNAGALDIGGIVWILGTEYPSELWRMWAIKSPNSTELSVCLTDCRDLSFCSSVRLSVIIFCTLLKQAFAILRFN